MPLNIVRNDITKMKADAIVNAANRTLLGGGGVDGAIHRAAGPELLEECRGLGGCETGDAKATKGYRLDCRYIIHTVGPVWRGGGFGERALLKSCYLNSLLLAAKLGCESIAFPLISAGAYGYPASEAFDVAAETIKEFLKDNEMDVSLVVFTNDALSAGEARFQEVVRFIDDRYVSEHFDENLNRTRRPYAEEEPDGDGFRFEFEKRRRAAENRRKESEERLKSAQKRVSSIGNSLSDLDLNEALPSSANMPISLQSMLRQMDESFSEMLLRLIDEKHMTDAECYKKANIDRRLFSKIRSNREYRPGKQTVLAFVIALELPMSQACDMLNKAGYALTHSSRFDIVLEYFITRRIYDVFAINEVLFRLDLPLLGV